MAPCMLLKYLPQHNDAQNRETWLATVPAITANLNELWLLILRSSSRGRGGYSLHLSMGCVSRQTVTGVSVAEYFYGHAGSAFYW